MKRYFRPFSQELIYGNSKDGVIKSLVKTCSTVEDLFERLEVKETTERIKEMVADHFGLDKPTGVIAQPTEDAQQHTVCLGFALDKETTDIFNNLDSVTHVPAVKQALEKKWGVAQCVQNLPDDKKSSLEMFERKAKQKVADHVQLVTEQKSSVAQAKMIAGTYVGSPTASWEARDTVLYIYDQKLAGESQTAPHLRVPPLKSERLKKCIQSITGIKDPDANALAEGDVFILMDAGVSGNAGSMMGAFANSDGKAITKAVSKLFLPYSE